MIDVDAPVTLLLGDVLDSLAQVPSESVHAVVTDPPYNINLKGGGAWDHYGPRAFSQWCEQWARECLRVLRPGGWIFSFGSGKSFPRMAVGIEDAGFQPMDGMVWIYAAAMRRAFALDEKLADVPDQEARDKLTGRAYALANRHDPIFVARKRSKDGLLATAIEHGTGTLDVTSTISINDSWPSNVIFSHHEECVQGESCVSGCPVAELGPPAAGFPCFYWCPKAPAAEKVSVNVDVSTGTKKLFHIDTKRWRCRHPGCGLITKSYQGSSNMSVPHLVCDHNDWEPLTRDAFSDTITHPSPKPLDLMRWMVRLSTPPSGLILDCFAGSGATVEAAVLEQRCIIAVERDPQYMELIRTRLRRQHCFRSSELTHV